MAALSELIRHDEPLSVGSTAVYPYKSNLEKKYRFTSRFGEEVLLHRVEGNVIHLPRALCPVPANDFRDDGDVVVFPKGPEPREYQAALFEEVGQLCLNRLSGVVVAMTGWGKTVLGYHAAYTIQRKTLVITTKEDIYDQWIKGAEKFLGLKPHEIGEIRGDKCEVIGTKFVVALIQSMSKEDKYPDWITKGFGLVIYDETHRVAANQFSAVADLFPAKMRLGLSATPERADGKEILVHAHIGPIRAKAQVEQLVPKVLRFTSAWECPRVFRHDPETGKKSVVRLPHQPGKTTHIEKKIAADPVRNALLGELIDMVHKKGRKLVVFSTLHAHLEALKQICIDVHGVPAADIALYIGTQSKADKAIRNAQTVRPILLTTYGMMGEGTDIPWLDTCLLAMPRSNVKQPVGRIRREYPDKREPIVIDVCDHDSPVFSGYASTRLKWYNQIQSKVVDMQ
ncbi:DEAD/DEAH box helicase family protein [Hyphomicrobium sp.]|uniref:DEAD/DEAH box helicase n=1 Tax=Hyphomicrobium sp. TaxID=82 RepID=UPI001DFEF55F|nr:DEAD/DEAH box helicase family protein [Hyphomicrobium sp.]MBY0560033.1 DEAD/DEAH box helicase family protein [Hyphomicrobium sp.]